jgi:hypothetical protein
MLPGPPEDEARSLLSDASTFIDYSASLLRFQPPVPLYLRPAGSLWLCLEGFSTADGTMGKISLVEDYLTLMAMRAQSRPEEDRILKLYSLETEPACFAPVKLGGKLCPRLSKRLKKHR